MNTYLHLLRREFWEHRAFLLVPAVVAAVVVFGIAYTLFYEVPNYMRLERLVEEMSRLSDASRTEYLSFAPVAVAVPFNIALVLVVFFYLLDSLYADRKDRSILFWKSLPVSDVQTVLSKVAIAMLVLPAIALIAALATVFIGSLFLSIAILIGGGSAFDLLWSSAAPVDSILFLVYAFAVQSLWFAPVFAWLLLASAWARRSPLLWALAPPLVIVLLEGMVLHTHVALEFLGQRMTGIVPTAFHGGPGGLRVNEDGLEFGATVLQLADPGRILLSPGLWGGLVVATLFVGAAIWLRRFRDET